MSVPAAAICPAVTLTDPVTTPGVMIWDSATVRGRIRVLGVAEAGPPVIERLRAQGADVTVLLGHAGLRGSGYASDQGVPPENDVAALLAAAPETDVAILGHTHGVIADTTVGTTLVTQPLFWAQSVAVVHLAMVRQGRRWVVARKWITGMAPRVRMNAALIERGDMTTVKEFNTLVEMKEPVKG
jgi:2',3'-cyclic-nucleotide 2'-phosphodiesterase (5'-nucleotidase family)